MMRRACCITASLAVMMVTAFCGCIKAKVETVHEIKPIHITMDINLKVQKDLDDFFGN
jgi:hypothetical protein